MTIIDYIRKVRAVHLPYLSTKFEIEPSEITKIICDSGIYKEARIVNNLFTLDTDIKAPWFEYCDTKYKRGDVVHQSLLDDHYLENQKTDQHISVYGHDQKWIENAKGTGSVSCRDTYVSPRHIYLELDRENIDKAVEDAYLIYTEFPYTEAMSFWYSGNRSIHISVDARIFGSPMGKQEDVNGIGKLFYNLAHKAAGDCRYGNGLVDSWTLPINDLKEAYRKQFGMENVENLSHQMMRQKLENIDPNLFRVNSLIRSPWSYHEKTDKQKVLVDPKKLLKKDFSAIAFKEKIPYIKPLLLHWVNECYEPVIKPTRHRMRTYNTDLIIKTFSENLENFDYIDANHRNWVDGLYSPFYGDTNPSVAVNIETGWYYDHGNPTDNFDFETFLKRINGTKN